MCVCTGQLGVTANGLWYQYKMDAICYEVTGKYWSVIIIFIILVIRSGHLEILKLLIEGKHCEPDAVDKNEWTALHYAAM